MIRLIRQELIPLNPPEVRPKITDEGIIRRLNEGTTYVWEPDEEIRRRGLRGFITMVLMADTLFIDMLAVHRSMQGRGIGTMLLNKAERMGRKRGLRRLQLYVNEGNSQGIRFYQKHGLNIAWYDPARRSFVMEKSLRERSV
jgi:ribosomal protein S18 acetylase RimI-like enzyme